jgi:soluble epoxide hydrolase/lipid-phosphate phosphatase
MGKPQIEKYCKKATIKEYDADHWVMFSHADELNKDLHDWVTTIVPESNF